MWTLSFLCATERHLFSIFYTVANEGIKLDYTHLPSHKKNKNAGVDGGSSGVLTMSVLDNRVT